MNALLTVMFGGAIGAGARHLVGVAMLARLGPGFPWWTLTVNLAGGLLMGLLVGTLARSGGSETARLLLGVGVLGGFTTFSSFGLECWTMVARGQPGVALGYAVVSTLGAMLLTGAGAWVSGTAR